MIRKLLLFALIGLLSSCQWAIPPDPAEGMSKPIQIVAPVLNENLGALFLTDEGLWAWRPESKKKDRVGLETGQVVVFGDLEETRRHVFAVVDTFDWGAILQRLDSTPIAARTSGSLVPLSGLGFQTAKRWNFCTGFGEKVDENGCIQDGSAGMLWDVYPLKSSERLLTREADAPSMPIPRAQLVWSGATQIIHGSLPDEAAGWLAVPASISPRPPLPSVLVSPECPKYEFADIRVVRAVNSGRDILSSTSTAYQHGVDAIFHCNADEITAVLPVLFRRTLPATERRLAIPSMLSIEPLEIEVKPSKASDVIRAYAYLGAGDAASADYYLERAIDRMDDSEEFGVRSMDVAASVGRPEVAVRRGRQATDSSWNREANPFWQLGLAHVLRALRMTGEFNEKITQIPSAASSAGEANFSGWLAWIELRRKLDAGAPPRNVGLDELLDRTSSPDFGVWRTAFKFEVLRRREIADIETLKEELDEAKASALYNAFVEPTEPRRCDEDCRLDAYGRTWPRLATLDPAARLEVAERAPWASFTPGYDLKVDLESMESGFDAGQKTRFWAATLGFLTEENADIARQKMIDAVVALASNCDPTSLDEVALAARAIEASITGDDDESTRWLGTTGLVTACRGLEALGEAAATYPRSMGPDAPSALYAALLARAADAELYRRTLLAAARYGSEHERGPRCEHWNLSLAAAAAQAGRLEAAGTFASAAAECRTSEFATTESVILAFLNFERTRSISRDFSKEVIEEVEELVHQRLPEGACAGLLPLRYDILSRLSPEVRETANRLQLVRKPIEDLDLVKASDSVTEARKALTSAQKALSERRPGDAWNALRTAREGFGKVRHLPGLALTDFLIESAFGDEYDEAKDSKPREAEARRKWNLRHGAFQELEGNSPSESIFIAWVQGGRDAMEARVNETGEKPEGLCNAPEITEPRPDTNIVFE